MSTIKLIIMLLLTLVVFGWPVWNLARLRGKQHPLFAIVPIVALIASFGFARVFEMKNMPEIYIAVKHLGYYILIIGTMLFSMSVLWQVIGYIFSFSKKALFWLIVLSTLAYSGIAAFNGQRIVVKEVRLPAENISREYNFVHITDLHHGSTDNAHLRRVVDMIKPLGAEFLVITGDFIDEFFVDAAGIAPFNELDFPMYLITGNHEYYLEDRKIDQVLQGSKIQLIDGMKIPYKELDIVGVNELATVDQTLRLVGGVDPDRYTILLDHQPKTHEAHSAESNGVRLMLSGHTHKGQVWPLGWLIKLQFKYISGLYEIGNMFLYVNQGTGTLGPKMRFNTVNEITLITLYPENI